MTTTTARPDTDGRLALVTGATGYVGGQVAAELLRRGWRVRVLSRSAEKVRGLEFGDRVVDDGVSAGPGEVEVVEGDASDAEVLQAALTGVDCAWYLLHSMGDADDFAAVERDMARAFADAAATADVGRIVYLGGLHPDGEDLSEHLASRVEVGRILMGSGVPTAALQAGVVLGDGSSSFHMLRHLAERLPAAVAPRWIRNRIQPIAADDAVHYLVGAADLPREINRTFDIGGPEAMPYADMMTRYATATGHLPRLVRSAPVTTPGLAAHWIGLVTPVPVALATPLIGSLLHDTVVSERDLDTLIGPPPGGHTPFDDAVRAASAGADAGRWPRTLTAVTAAVAVAGAVRVVLDGRGGRDPRGPLATIIDTVALADLALFSALSIADLAETGHRAGAGGLAGVLGAHVVLLAVGVGRPRSGPVGVPAGSRGWASRLAVTATAAELTRRAWAVAPQKGVVALPHVLWAALSG